MPLTDLHREAIRVANAYGVPLTVGNAEDFSQIFAHEMVYTNGERLSSDVAIGKVAVSHFIDDVLDTKIIVSSLNEAAGLLSRHGSTPLGAVDIEVKNFCRPGMWDGLLSVELRSDGNVVTDILDLPSDEEVSSLFVARLALESSLDRLENEDFQWGGETSALDSMQLEALRVYVSRAFEPCSC